MSHRSKRQALAAFVLAAALTGCVGAAEPGSSSKASAIATKAVSVEPAVGNCYNLTPAQVDVTSSDVPPVDCSKAHTAETVAISDWPSDTPPFSMTDKKAAMTARGVCESSVLALDEPDLNYWAFYVPTKQQWQAGDHRLRCDAMHSTEDSAGKTVFIAWHGPLVGPTRAANPGVVISTKKINASGQCWETFEYPVFKRSTSEDALPESVVTMLNADVQRAIATVPQHNDSSCDADFRGLLALEASVNWNQQGLVVVVFSGYAMETGSAHGSHMQWTSSYFTPSGQPFDLLGQIGFEGKYKLRELASQAVIDKYGQDAFADDSGDVPGIYDDPKAAFSTWSFTTRGLKIQFPDCMVTSCGVEPPASVTIPWSDASAALYPSKFLATKVLPYVWN